ncbi:hypothetical protein GCM10010329_38010 [Streptomyces spiroverticillatus]|uniref:Carrier domain-containing protein n=1 Tax=Streptomyces finlayi TaxID=67296 RepID=A0A918WY62_9ACTN|nr:non-ribosomal peptide synthetase [Streptomyces finlayi]GHA11513.1 hypothetical protein GCM10010329_38010 [Streptomyces spiroverticillatus]GHC94967.1 hypothetical protein GCM10010334_33600 [Streptomyces finlayi]
MESTDRRQPALSPTKRALLARLREGTDPGGRSTGAAIPRRPDPGTAPATRAQESLWFLDQYLGSGTNSTYNLWSALRLRKALDVDRLAECLRRAVARHEALRTTLVAGEGGVRQRIARAAEVKLPVRETEPERARQVVSAVAREPFDLAAGPLFRPTLFRLGPDDHVLLITAHHAVFDGVSAGVLLREIAADYSAPAGDGGGAHGDAGSPVDEPATRYGDWAAWTRQPEREADLERQLAYWSRRLAGAPPLLELPTDHQRPTVRSFAGAEVTTRLDGPGVAALRELCRQEGVTLFTAVLAAYQVALARHSGQRDICVGMPTAGRTRPETQDVVGYLVNTVVVRGRVDGTDTFRGLLRATRASTVEALEHQEVPFDQVVAELSPDRSDAHNPLFQAYLDVTRATDTAPPEFTGLDCSWYELPGADAKFDLSLGVTEHEDRLELDLDYRADLFEAATMSRFAGRLVELLNDVASLPDRPLADLPPLPAHELRAELGSGQGETVPVDDGSLAEGLAAQAARTPDAVAVRHEGQELTYRQLDSRANRLARRLLDLGAGPGRVVAVAVPRSLDLIVALGAVARAGAAYLPLDADLPVDRLRFMLDEARPVCLLTVAAHGDDLSDTLPRITLDQADAELSAHADTPVRDEELPTPRHPSDPAYALFTSGSTGRPKGVLVPQQGILNRLRWMQAAYRLTPDDRVLHKTPTTFDVSVWELFWPLLEGATLVVARPDGHRDPYYLADLMRREAVTTAHFVPAMLEVFLQEPQAGACTALRRIVCSGEALPRPLADRFHEVLAGVELHNLYGPTEASVDVTHWPCPPGEDGDVPIGTPVWNTAVHVLDDDLNPVPSGTPGELYLAGVQLALGYLRRPGLTAERFVPDPWGAPGTRMYRTGDLVRRRSDSALMYLGRTDHQVKIRGLRVELGEIEAVLAAHPSVARALVTVRADRPQEQRLTGYVIAAEGHTPDPEVLRAEAAATLPGYMVPADILLLEQLPTTINGKTDRAALPAPTTTERQRFDAVPVTEQEALLCSIFTELLALDDAGPLDDFFALGGDSIGSIHLVGRARRAGLLLTARQIFQHRTPRALAAVAAPVDGGATEADDGTGVVPTTPIMRWWRAAGGPTGGYHQSMLVSTPPGMSGPQLAAVLQAVVDRHDMLRARLVAVDGEEVLEVPAAGTFDANSVVERTDITKAGGLPAGAREAHEARVAPLLVPEDGRMVRAVWFDAGPQAPGRLLLVVHHLVVDGVSWRILQDDLAHAWSDVAAARRPELDPVPVSFRRYARLLHDQARSERRTVELGHWTGSVASEGTLAGWAIDPEQDTVQRAAALERTLPGELTARLVGPVARTFRTGVEQVLLTGLALAVHARQNRRGAQSGAVSVNLEGHGREGSLGELDLSRTVGWFTSLYPVRLDVSGIDTDDALAGGPAAGTALKRVKEQLAAVPDHGVGHGLLRWLNPVAKKALAALPAPPIGFNYLGRFAASAATETVRDWAAVPGEPLLSGGIPDGTPLAHPLDIVALTEDHADGPRLTLSLTRSTRLLSEADLEEFAELWTEALEGLARHADDPSAGGVTPSDLTLGGLAQDEIDALQAEFANDMDVDFGTDAAIDMDFDRDFDMDGEGDL